MKRNGASFVPRKRDGERGQVLVTTALALFALLGMAALVVDAGTLYYSYQQLVAATDAAALAAGAAIPAGNATAAATQYSAASQELNSHPNLQNVKVTATLQCLTASGLPPCLVYGNQTAANAIIVTQTATVPTFFAKTFGVNSLNISATATATAKGGGGGPYNVMMVLDTTASMGSTIDSACSVPGLEGNPTAEECAQYGIQQLLGGLTPCPATDQACVTQTSGNSLTANAVDEAGLMVFPGLNPCPSGTGTCAAENTLSNPPVQAPDAADDFSCPTTNPATVPYNENPAYLIVPFGNNYRVSDTATTLNGGRSGADIVKGVGAGVGTCSGVGTPGGQGTFYAGAITAAWNYLQANTRPNVQNVLILLSDGDANASSQQMAGAATNYPASQECQQAVTAANNARTAAGTMADGRPALIIYSVSYGSENTGCTTDTSPSTTPCATMEGIGSSPATTYFFSVPNSGQKGGTVCSGARSTTSLNQVFTDIAGDLTLARLIPNGTP